MEGWILDKDVADGVDDKNNEVEPVFVGSKDDEEAGIEFEQAAVKGFDAVGPDDGIEEQTDGVGHDCLRPWRVDEHEDFVPKIF